MAGDSIPDIAMARAARIRTAAVGHGYTDIPVLSLKAGHVINSFAELPAAVNPILGQPVGNI
jgi:phosphoglycolate phosphatase-like HAD superfamily hydrolase